MIAPGASVTPPYTVMGCPTSSHWWVTLQLTPDFATIGHRPDLNEAIDEALVLAVECFEGEPEQLELKLE